MKNLFTTLLLLVLTITVSAQIKRWDGDAGTPNWADAANWNGNTVPTHGDSVVLDHSLFAGNYTVILPNTTVTVKSLNVYPSNANDSIFVVIPATNNVSPNLRVTGVGYNALRIGNRARLHNNSAATSVVDVFKIDDIANNGFLLDTGGYYYHGSMSKDTTMLLNLETRYNSTFEYDKPSGSYDIMIFPLASPIDSIIFHHLIFSGTKAGVNRPYGGTLANNWTMVVNGHLTVRNKASFGLVRGAAGQDRTVHLRGNIIIQNTTANTWMESSAPLTFGWYVIFDGNSPQTITGNMVLQEKTTLNNAAGLTVDGSFVVKAGFIFPIDPSLVLTNGLLTTLGSGEVFVNISDPTKLSGYSASSYINGKLKRTVSGTGTYDLPVGKSAHYQLATVTLTSVTGISNLSTEFFTTGLSIIPTSLNESGITYLDILDAGFWRITPNAAMTGGSYKLKLNERGYSTAPWSLYTVIKRADGAGAWGLQGTHVSYSKSSTISAERNGYTSFSDFAIAAGSAVVLWDGEAGTSNWSDANNWSRNNVPVIGDSVVLNHRLLTGDYTVTLPNSAVTIRSLSIYPSSAGDSIFLALPSTNTVAKNLRVTGVGFHALSVGARGRINNRHGGSVADSSIVINDVANYGFLLDEGGYYFNGTRTKDIAILYNLKANANSTFEYDMPFLNNFMVFPLSSPITELRFHHLILSGTNNPNVAYAVTLANDWNLYINGDLTVRNSASFGLVRGNTGQENRTVYIRGNISVINTTNISWIESATPVGLGWNTVFDGSALQTITGNVSFLDKTTINNPYGVLVNNQFNIKSTFFYPNDPSLVLTNGVLKTQGSGIVHVTLTNPSKLSGYSISSYINGKLKRSVISTAAYDFPVGSATHYQLASVNLTGVTGISDLTAEFFTTGLANIPTPLNESGKSYTDVLNAGFWRITPNAAMTGGSYAVTLQMKGHTPLGGDYYTVVKRANELANWAIQGAHQSFSDISSTVTAARTGFTSFSDFIVASGINPLPITLAKFEAHMTPNKKVKLEWVTATEKNNAYFTIEKSSDGISWNPIITLKGAGNSNTYKPYEAMDNFPFSGLSYYRLKQTDFDGYHEYSAMKVVHFEEARKEDMNVYPNPTTDYVIVNGGISKGVTLNIFNNFGVKCWSQEVLEDSNGFRVNLGHLPAGQYLLQIKDRIFKIVKN